MRKDRAMSALSGDKKSQPKKGTSKRGEKKSAHAVHARRVENGYATQTHFKGKEGEPDEMQEHIHPSLQDLLSHIQNHLPEEEGEIQNGGGEQPAGGQMPPQGGEEA